MSLLEVPVVSRCPLVIRDATPDDVPALQDILTSVASRDVNQSGPRDVESAVARIAADPDQRLLVAVQDDDAVGAVLLVRAPLTPLHSDLALHVLHLHVREDARRRGVGRALMEATVSWAEEKDTMHILAAAAVGSRDSNRFLARLGLGQVALIRAATVTSLRSKLPLEPPAAARVGNRAHRNVGQVLARRRSLRRAQERTS
ncbi:MAG: GNAT family N-acetyltransferase [Nocardioides sp.]